MILELDCGNSCIKWRVLHLQADSAAVFASGIAASGEQVVESLLCLAGLSLRRCRLASVRSAVETQELVLRLERAFGIATAVAVSVAELAGVKNGYCEPEQLGVDRWLAVLAAYCSSGRACLVIDVGTAVTSDFVADNGAHLGGYICPGLRLLGGSLAASAHGLGGVSVAGFAGGDLSPGRCTYDAVSRGGVLMLRAFIDAQVHLAGEMFPGGFEIFLTGGDAALVGVLDAPVRNVQDLVFAGLAIACP